MSSGFPSELDSNKLAQLQKLIRLSFNLAEYGTYTVQPELNLTH